jgi:Fic family protein
MRTFEQTHPWISYRVDFSKPNPEFWLDLGEAASKCEHIARVPLRPETALKLHQLYLAKGAAASTAIEGNTLSEAEVLEAVEGKLQVPKSKEYQKQEVENIIGVCRSIAEELKAGTLPSLTPEIIKRYNREVLKELPKEHEEEIPGEIRTYSVLVGNVYRGAPDVDCDFLLERLCEWLNGSDFEPLPGRELIYAIIKAVISHLYLAWIHPFGNGNGRTARLLEFHILLKAGVPSPAAHLLSNHYNQTREEYYRQLNHASKSGGDIMPFLRYAVQGFVDGLKGQLDYIWNQQWDLAWENYVHDLFRAKSGATNKRQRDLALDLGSVDDWIEISKITEFTPRLAKAYAGKTGKTVQRDLNMLATHHLVYRDGRKIKANRELILAFLPLRNHPST